MRKLEYIYFTIYNHYSRRSDVHDSPFVRFKSMCLLSISVGGWILLLQLLILRFGRNAWFTSQSAAMVFSVAVYTAITAVFYNILIVNGRDQKIFSKYADAWNNNPNKRRDFFIALFIAAVPYVSMMAVKIFFPRY